MRILIQDPDVFYLVINDLRNVPGEAVPTLLEDEGISTIQFVSIQH
jgi:hypothetical protein